jgi:hypothetical protein
MSFKFNKYSYLSRPMLLCAVAMLTGLSSCSAPDASSNDEFAPIFWQKRDDFSSVDAYYLDAKIWIDRQEGEYIALQFQCFRHLGAEVSIDQNLIVNSSVDAKISNGSARYIDSILFKSENDAPQVYRNPYNGSVLATFKDANLKLSDMISLNKDNEYRSLKIRFVYGASPVTAQLGDVDELSRADSVDFDLSSTNPETKKFLLACAPVKNWTPPS